MTKTQRKLRILKSIGPKFFDRRNGKFDNQPEMVNDHGTIFLYHGISLHILRTLSVESQSMPMKVALDCNFRSIFNIYLILSKVVKKYAKLVAQRFAIIAFVFCSIPPPCL